MEVDNIHVGDALTVLKTLPAESVNCVVTSPPYYGLRDYGCEGQIGLEDTPQAFIARLIAVFAEIKRVLRKDGVVWVNLGDSYGSGEIGRHDSVQGRSIDGRAVTSKLSDHRQQKTIATHSSKNLMMIPARFAIAMQDAGWILRSECVWVKPNPMPESVTDRPTKSHEMVYLFAKSPKYWYDADAIREEANPEYADRYKYAFNVGTKEINGGGRPNGARNTAGTKEFSGTRNRRDVFTVTTEATPFAHFATFPQALIEPLILAGCPEKVCAECGKPYTREVEATGGTIGKSWHDHSADLSSGMTQVKHSGGVGSAKDTNGNPYTRIDKGLHRRCKHIETTDTRAGVVLDPFMGSGTTAIVARRLGRHYVGIELNPEYAALAETRLQHTSKDELNAALSGKPTTLPMFE